MKPIWYSSDEVGAPTLNNAAGSLIALLDAILTTGFNVKAVTSISVAAGVATAVISAHGYGVGRTIALAGATPAGLNGNFEVTAVVDSNTVRFAAPGVADGTASGTITARRAPLGWVKAYAGTNTAIYQRTDPLATGMLLRVDDTGAGVAAATYARALMLESASSIDTYGAITPTAAQISGGLYVSKGPSSATAKPWVAVGDGRTLYLLTEHPSLSFASYTGLSAFTFGDIASWRTAGDAYGCLIGGGYNTSLRSGVSLAAGTLFNNGIYLARPTNFVGGAVSAAFAGRAADYAGNSSLTGCAYPSPVDGGMAVERNIIVRENTSTASFPMRGLARGMAHPLGIVPAELHGQVLDNLLGTTDKFLIVRCVDTSNAGALAFNIASEWRD